MQTIPSLLRLEEHRALATVILSGSVLDLGGDKQGEYLSYLKGTFATTCVNIDAGARPDIVHDLERPLPIADAQYDHALLANVLEHVFNYRELLREAARVVRPGGSLVILVPFLFPIHPSPRDYWRFTEEALRKELEQLNLRDISVTPLGSGVFAARYVLLSRLLPAPLRVLGYHTGRYGVMVSDWCFAGLAQALGKQYRPRDYPLGYLARAVR